ncbi:MAG: hypothetical protein K8I03_03600 [Ignavibacteria bacterium]|nr:hypothetical protein [Ignavibacteria bacterium]
MTKLLSKAFEKASELSDDSQDLLAKRLLEEIEDELKWNRSFDDSKAVLNSLAAKAIEQSKEHKTRKIGFDQPSHQQQ